MSTLNRTITRWQGIGLIATTFLGTGVFILPQLTIASAGDWAIWTWALLLLGIAPLAWVFAELGKRYSHAGGPAFFVQEAFGVRYGHIIGLLFVCVVPIGAPAALMMTLEFVKPLVALTSLQLLIVQLSIIGCLFFVNIRGLQLSGKIQLALTLLIATVVGVMLIAFLNSDAPVADNIVKGSSSGVMVAISLAIWGFLGIEAVTHLSAEFRDVEKDFVPSVLLGVAVVGVIYMLCTYLSMLSPNTGNTESLAMVDAFQILIGDGGRWVIAILGVVSGIATVNIYFASVARLAWVLSKDGVLPAQLKTLNQHNVPMNALSTMLTISCLIVLGAYFSEQPFEAMVRWVNGVFVIIYAASMLAAWRLLDAKHRPSIIIALLVCVVFAICLGATMIYAVVLAAALVLWLRVNPPTARPRQSNN